MSDIKMPGQKNGPSPGLKLASIVGGVMTANPAMVVGGLASNSSPLGKAAGLVNTAQGVAGGLGGLGAGSMPQTDQNFKMPEIGSQFKGNAPSLETDAGSAIGRAYQNAQNDPMYKIHEGLQHLDDPELANSMPYEHYMGAVEPLLRAKHFGVGGGQ